MHFPTACIHMHALNVVASWEPWLFLFVDSIERCKVKFSWLVIFLNTCWYVMLGTDAPVLPVWLSGAEPNPVKRIFTLSLSVSALKGIDVRGSVHIFEGNRVNSSFIKLRILSPSHSIALYSIETFNYAFENTTCSDVFFFFHWFIHKRNKTLCMLL